MPGRGYVGMRAYYLMRELSEKGCAVDLVTSSTNQFQNSAHKPEALRISDNFSFFTLRGTRFAKSGAIVRILSWIQFELNFLLFNKKKLRKPDVIIVSSPSILTIINGIYWSRIYKAKLVFEIRDIWPLTLVEEGGSSESNPIIKALAALERWGYRSSDLVIGTMPNLFDHVATVCGEVAPRVICVPIGIPDEDSKYFGSTKNCDQRRDSGNLRIAYVGTIGTTNALETLFEALTQLDLPELEVDVVIVGDGPLLEHYIGKYGTTPNVTFLGPVEKEAVGDLLTTFDILYFSTFKSRVWQYGQSLNKIVDYMLSGKPVLGSYSGFASMLNEADCGWFVDAEDSGALAKSITLLSSMDRKKLVEKGRSGFDWITRHRKYSKLADALLAEIRNI